MDVRIELEKKHECTIVYPPLHFGSPQYKIVKNFSGTIIAIRVKNIVKLMNSIDRAHPLIN